MYTSSTDKAAPTPHESPMKNALAERREIERDERMKRIIAAAKKVFLEKGYFGTGVRGIAQEARLSPGAIYYYFSGVDEIYVIICEESFVLINKALMKGMKSGVTCIEKLEHMAAGFMNYFLKNPEYTDLFVFSNIGWNRVNLRPELSARLERALSKSLSLVLSVVEDGKKKGEIRNDVDSIMMVHALWVSIEGLFLLDRRGLLEKSGFRIRQLLKTQLNIIARGLAP